MFSPLPDQAKRQLLAEALELSRYVLHSDGDAADPALNRRRDRLRHIREVLKAFAHPICQERLAVATVPLTVRQTFAKAALLVTRYQQVGGRHWQGTLASPTLSQYRADAIPASLLSSGAIAQLCQVFELPTAMAVELKATLDAVDRQIAQQQAIIRSVLASVPQRSGQPDPHALFHYLFGPIPIPAAAIDLVYTDMQLFFCIDYEDDRLRDKAVWQQLTEAERQQISPFLRSLKQFSFAQFRRFPVFGPCTGQQLDCAWCEAVAQPLGVTASEVIQLLLRSVGIVPTAKAEAFLVHDIWGHHWQLILTQFESDYAILTTCDEPLRAVETAYTAAGPLTCQELFIVTQNQVTIDEAAARLFFQAEVQQRLGLLFTHLIGEMMADVAEFKFVWDNPHAAAQLLSSSLFKAEPTKLDLSLADVDFLFLRVLRPLLDVHLSVLEDSQLETELLTIWKQVGDTVDSLELRTSLKQAIAHLYQIFLQEYNQTYLPTMAGETSLFTQIVSNLLHLQNAVNTLYTDFAGSAKAALPFQDLLIIFVGCFCSSDSFAEFWAIDDVLANYFLPCWLQWCDAATEPAVN